jgi:hypothetical protein
VTLTCSKGCAEITPFTTLTTFPVFFSVTTISLGPKNAIAVGALRPVVINCDFKLLSVKFRVAFVIFALENAGEIGPKDDPDKITTIVRINKIAIAKI